MRFGFKPMYFDTACTPLDLDEGPATLELTRIGELVVHNWDREVDEAQAALGFDQSLCMTLTPELVEDNDGCAFPSASRRASVVVLLRDQAGWRGCFLIRSSRHSARASTKKQEPVCSSVLRASARMALNRSPRKQRDHCFWRRRSKRVFDLLDAVHQGRILDEEQNEWVMAAAIVGWVTENLAFVKAGRVVPTTDPEAAPFQIRVVSSTALIEQKFSKIWVIKEWVEE